MSAISLPPVKDYNVNQNFITLTREINLLKDAVNAKQVSVGYGFTGKEGDSRIAVDTDGNVHFDINSRNGWFTTFDGCFYPKTKDGHAQLHLKTLEVDNFFAKTFTIKQTNAFNGDWIVSDAGIVESILGNIVTFKDQTNLNACPFVVGDIIFTRRIKADKSLDIKYIKGTVATVSGKSITVTYTSTDRFAIGDTIVRVGNSVDSTRRDSIFISTNESNTPYIDIYDGISTWSGTGTNNWDYRSPILRIGNLKGINVSYTKGIYLGAGCELIINAGASITGLTPFLPPAANYTSGTTFPLTPNEGDWHFYTKNPPDAPYLTNAWYRYNGAAWINYGTIGTYIGGDGIYTGTIVASQVIAGTLTGFTIQTAASGQRVVISNGSQITFFDGGTGNIKMTATFHDGDTYLGFSGRIEGTYALFNSVGLDLSGTRAWLTIDGSSNLVWNSNIMASRGWVGAQNYLVNPGASSGWLYHDGFGGFSWSNPSWGDVLNKPSTFAPTSHGNEAHSSAFITLSSLSGTSPISYNNGTGAISISAANGSTNGYLSSTDWSIFNGKANAFTGLNGTYTFITAIAGSCSGGYLQVTGYTSQSFTFTNGVLTSVGTPSVVNCIL